MENFRRTAAHRAVKLLGRDTILEMLPPQRGHFNMALTRMVNRHKGSDTITEREIFGAYNMVMDHACPIALVMAYGQVAKPVAESE